MMKDYETKIIKDYSRHEGTIKVFYKDELIYEHTESFFTFEEETNIIKAHNRTKLIDEMLNGKS